MSLKDWIESTIFSLAREMRWSYLPPLMVYVAAGISGLTAIVGTFFIKDYLGLSAQFIAALGFWAGLPWALKMPLGHLVDLIWRWKAWLVFLGAGLIAISLLIMIGLLADPALMRSYASLEHWYVLSVILAPIGYVTQDVVADALTVEAVPAINLDGSEISDADRKQMHTTMQTLGRVAIIGGGLLVSLINVVLLRGVDQLAEADRLAVYLQVYGLALLIPLVSVSGVLLGLFLMERRRRAFRAVGHSQEAVDQLMAVQTERPHVNWWVLGGGLVFSALSISIGLADSPFLQRWGQELIFVASMTVILVIMMRLVRELTPEARSTLIGTAFVIFVFRALPLPGEGATWWQIDVLSFDQQFLSVLSLISGALTLLGLFVFRRFMAQRSIYAIVGILSVLGFVLSLPVLGMFYGLHEWTAMHTGGMVDARFIALANTALESPLGQVAMVPMLAWIANSAPTNLKATFFAVMASFTNLALSASSLGTKYLNDWFTITREVRANGAGRVAVPADYSELGSLLIIASVLALLVPLLAIVIARAARMRSA